MGLPRTCAALVLVGASTSACSTENTPTLRIFTAASAADAVTEAAAACQPADAPAATVVAGASSTLARQIEHGAPAALFVSANPTWMDHLQAAGHVGAATRRDLLANSLVVVAPAQSAQPFTLGADTNLAALIGDGRLALADPDHVPAGMYAKTALTSLGLYGSVESRLARSADVRAALVLVERGEAPLGIVYDTDASASSAVRVVAQVPAGSHPPVTYPMAIVTGHGEDPGVQQLWTCLQADPATAVFQRHGFRRP